MIAHGPHRRHGRPGAIRGHASRLLVVAMVAAAALAGWLVLGAAGAAIIGWV
jgi:hypothetical protein